MSSTSEAITLIKHLKPKLGEQVATELVDYANKRHTGDIDQLSKSIDRLWIALGILAAVMVGGFTWLRADMQDLKADVQYLKADVQDLKTDVQNLKTDLKSVNRKLDILLRNKR